MGTSGEGVHSEFMRTPLPDLRLDLESQANFGLEQTFKIFKGLQNEFQLAELIQDTVLEY